VAFLSLSMDITKDARPNSQDVEEDGRREEEEEEKARKEDDGEEAEDEGVKKKSTSSTSSSGGKRSLRRLGEENEEDEESPPSSGGTQEIRQKKTLNAKKKSVMKKVLPPNRWEMKSFDVDVDVAFNSPSAVESSLAMRPSPPLPFFPFAAPWRVERNVFLSHTKLMGCGCERACERAEGGGNVIQP